jgi:hypothetical protein
VKVLVFVEGPSDRDVLTTLLEPLMREKLQAEVSIGFHPVGGKGRLLDDKGIGKFANILKEEAGSVVVALPDLYPMLAAHPYATCRDLTEGLRARIRLRLESCVDTDLGPLLARFRAFYLKHELEALVLACEQGLRKRLNTSSFKVEWTKPVEDQDFDRPPKRVVKELFEAHGHRYVESYDPAQIVAGSSYQGVADKCQQCFKPFVDFLSNLPSL